MIAALRRVSRTKLAWLGFGLITAPSYFVTAAVLKYGLGVGFLFDPLAAFFAAPQRLRFLNLVLTPLLFFGGSLLALTLNVYAILGHRADNGRKRQLANVLVILVSFSLLVVMTTYGYLENFTHR